MAFKNYPEDPTLYKMRNGTSDPFLKIDQTDQVRNQIILLHEVPDKFQGITISDGNKNYSVKDSGLPDPITIVIDWIQGKLTTHSSLEGKTLTCSYYGKGNVYFPSSKVYVDTDKTTGEVKETLKNLTDDMMENRDIAAETNRVVQAAENIREQNETTRQFQEQVRQERINNTRFVSPYNSNTTYQLNNMVSFNGHSFIAKKQTKGNPPPTDVTVVTENEYWALMSRKGTDGTGTVHVHRDKFVATEGQRTFTLSHTYDQFQNRTNVTVGGVPQKTPENYEETTDKIITLSEGVPAGTIIEVKYFSESVPLQSDIQTTVDNHTGILSTHATKLNNHELELVNVNAQLAQKAEQNQVDSIDARTLNLEINKRDKSSKISNTDLDISSDSTKIKLINLSDEVKQSMAGITPITASVGKSSVGNDNYAPKSIGDNKIKSFNIGKNLFNPNAVTIGFRLAADNGNLVESSISSVSDFISVLSDTEYTMTYPNTICFYDIHYNLISSQSTQNTPTVIKTQSNCAFVRFTVLNVFLNTMQFEIGNVATPYEPYHIEIKELATPTFDLKSFNIELEYLDGKIAKVYEKKDGIIVKTTSLNFNNGTLESVVEVSSENKATTNIIRTDGLISGFNRSVAKL